MVTVAAEEAEEKAEEPATNPTEEENSVVEGNFQVGDNIDVLDTVGKWCEAQIIEIDLISRKIEVTYLYWPDLFNEWIDFDSKRIAVAGSKTYQIGGELRLGHRIEAKDTTNRWIEAEVIGTCGNEVRIHYRNWHAKFDEDLPRDSDRIRPYGHTKILNKKSKPSSSKTRVARVTPLRQTNRTRQTTVTQFSRYLEALNRQQLGVKEIEGDGNCLFRSISHQIYGDDRFHMLIREKCMEYMLCEKEYFQPFIEGNMSDFMSYLEHKLQNGVWGDDPEIQAICEIYNRPAEIWCFDPVEGARKMRTFHEGGGGNQTSHRAPMRLSYYGGGHYDSVYSLTNFQPLVNTPPGIEENERILLAQQRCDTGMLEETKEQSDVLATEQEELSLALQTSREAFERLDDDLDVLFQHQTNMVLAANDTEQTTQDMLRGAEEHEVNQALQLSQVQDDTDDLQRALAMSAEGDMTVDPELQHALQISQQQPTNDLDAAIALSLNSHDGGGFPAALYDEDDELQRAIEMSHQFG